MGQITMMFKKKHADGRTMTKVEKRVSMLPTAELITWSDQVLYSVGRSISSWQRGQDKFSLDEAKLGTEVLTAIVNALEERTHK